MPKDLYGYDLAEGFALISLSPEGLPCDGGDDGHRCGPIGKLAGLECDHLHRGDRVLAIPIDKRRVGGAEDVVSSMKSVKLAPTL